MVEILLTALNAVQDGHGRTPPFQIQGDKTIVRPAGVVNDLRVENETARQYHYRRPLSIRDCAGVGSLWGKIKRRIARHDLVGGRKIVRPGRKNAQSSSSAADAAQLKIVS